MGAIARGLPRPGLGRLRGASLPPWQTLRRRALIFAILLVAVAAGYHFWLRNSSLVAVERVSVVGAEQAPAVDAKLREAGLEQTTLAVDLDRLREAVASEPAVRSLSAEADFPHGLTIAVDLRSPAGYLRSAGVVVAGDGVVLERAGAAPEAVPVIKVAGAKPPGPPGSSLDGDALSAAQVLGAVPAPLAPLVETARLDESIGVVVDLQGGLELRFGGRGDAELKWRAAAAVLAARDFDGAAYIDLSVPERPVAGGVPEVAEEAPTATPETATAPPVDPASGLPATPDPTVEGVPAPAIEPLE